MAEGIQRALGLDTSPWRLGEVWPLDAIKTIEKVIFAGDLNFPVDKMNGKTKILLDYLHGEGLILVNDGKVLTYLTTRLAIRQR